jgi:hypothetical protein
MMIEKSGWLASSEKTDANAEKMEPNPGEKEAIVEWQGITNKEEAIYSLRAC